MLDLKILNSKEIKELLKLIEEQWGAKLKLDYGFLKNSKNRIFLINRDIGNVDISKLRPNNIGMYFCEHDEIGIRLSIEGSQIVGPDAKKNIVEIDYDSAKRWFKGEDIEYEGECRDFVILKCNNDYLGTGKVAKGRILNYVSKSRRISSV